jgi:hypothetical protein
MILIHGLWHADLGNLRQVCESIELDKINPKSGIG